MDIATVTQALDELRRYRPHLPQPDDLARRVLAAWTGSAPTSSGSPNGPMAAVVAVTWPIGAQAGAARGHQVAAAALRDMLAHALSDLPADPDGRTVIWAAALAMDRLPAAPDTAEVTQRAHGRLQWVGDTDDLDVALALGLGNGWLAGHRDATQRLTERFADHVAELVGAQKLTTTFLNANLTGDDVVRAFETAAYHAAERDQDHPGSPPRPNAARSGPAVSRAFPQLRLVHPQDRNTPNTNRNPPSGPDRPAGPAR
jgi:hypothetical protein